MKWIETITPKQAVEELGVPYHGWMREMDRAWISEDQKYSVMSRLLRTEWGKVEHVTITAAEGVGRSDGGGIYHPDRGRAAYGWMVLGRKSNGRKIGRKKKGGYMKAHLSFLCNGQCRWCKNYWDCSKHKKILAKIFGCKDWRWQNR